MNSYERWKHFMTHFFPTFLGGFFLACFSASLAVVLAAAAYLKHNPDRANYTLVSLMVLALVISGSHMLLVRGRAWSLWPILAVMLVAMLVSLSTYSHHIHAGVFTFALLFPLLGFLLFNSKRHRQLRSFLVDLRKVRFEETQQGKARR